MVSKELLRVTILWHKMWHEALSEASRIFWSAPTTLPIKGVP